MNEGRIIIPLLAGLLAVSCVTTVPEPREEREPEAISVLTIEDTESEIEPEPEIELEPEETAFDPATITLEEYNEIKDDITSFIYELNAIIRSKNYKAWRMHLDDDYYNYISSPEYLQKVSSTGIMQKNKIVITTVNEYFMYVVVPSRYRDRVDDIEITGVNRVKVITVDNGVRLRLYDLEKTKNGWKIVIPDSMNL
jgi:hypothetical protein